MSKPEIFHGDRCVIRTMTANLLNKQLETTVLLLV